MGIEKCGNKRNFYGTIKSGDRKCGWNASFNDMPVEQKKICIKRRSTLSIVDLDEEQQEHDHVEEDCEKIEEK